MPVAYKKVISVVRQLLIKKQYQLLNHQTIRELSFCRVILLVPCNRTTSY